MIGTELRKIRLELGYTQAKMASEIGVHPTSITHLERGNRPITEYLQMKVERALRRVGRAYNPDILDK